MDFKTQQDNQAFGRVFEDLYSQENISENLTHALESLRSFIPGNTLTGKTFLDAGCGGGIYSLAASKLKPERIFSFDVDPLMLKFAENLKQKSDFQKSWDINQGSILDKNFVNSLGQFDYVYCWGVVHHTGKMWEALDNITSSVSDNGHIYLGLYNDASAFGFWDDGRFGSSQFWRKIKYVLFKSPFFVKKLVLLMAKLVYLIFSSIGRVIGAYKFKDFHARGMNSHTAIGDWLFGHPYEFASVDQVFKFMKERNFELEQLESNIGLRTNHYLFRKNRKLT